MKFRGDSLCDGKIQKSYIPKFIFGEFITIKLLATNQNPSTSMYFQCKQQGILLELSEVKKLENKLKLRITWYQKYLSITRI